MKKFARSLGYSIGILFFLLGIPCVKIQAACPLPSGSNVSVGANTCTISAITGTDNSVLTLDNAASSVTINNGGELCVGSLQTNAGATSIQTGGTIKTNCMLYVTDTDSDGYPPNLTMYDATGTGRRRVSLMTSLTNLDCNDGNATTFSTLTCYADADGDGYASTASQSVCGGSTCAAAGYAATPGTDCCDTDANAHPGQTTYFTTARTGCGGYDYNCDSVETHSVTSGASGCGTCSNNTGTQSCSWSGGTGGWIAGDPGCGNTATTQQPGMCNEMTSYPNCSITGCATFSTTQSCL